MVEVSGVYRHGKYERIWMKGLHIILKVKVFSKKDRRVDGQLSKHDW